MKTHTMKCGIVEVFIIPVASKWVMVVEVNWRKIYRHDYTRISSAKRGAYRFLKRLTASSMTATIGARTNKWVKS